MQILHLLLADLLWIAFVLLAVRALSLPLRAPVREAATAVAASTSGLPAFTGAFEGLSPGPSRDSGLHRGFRGPSRAFGALR